MKKLLAAGLLLAMLCGCSGPDTYLTVKPHAGSKPQSMAENAVMVQNYDGLKKAILGFVENGQSKGNIRAANYVGDVEEDLAKATYEVLKLEPLGAYAVDYLSHDSTMIINHYDINIDITFRRTPQEIAAVESVATQPMLVERLHQAAENYEPRVALRMGGYREQDIEALILDYCRAHPDTIMEKPELRVNLYPDRGSVRIVEVEQTYQHQRKELEEMQVAVRDSVDAAAEYIRYRETDWAKAELLYTYLMERFTYEEAPTTTPVYDALCRGIVSPQGMADAWNLICTRAGLECYTVEGLKNGEPYTWNILGLDGQYRHLDLADCVLNGRGFVVMTDGQMGSYYWNPTDYPACAAPEVPKPERPPEDAAQKPEAEPEEQGEDTDPADLPQTPATPQEPEPPAPHDEEINQAA